MGELIMSMYGKWNDVKKGDRINPGTSFVGDRGMTVQSDRDDADINKIVSRFDKNDAIVRLNSREPFYGDVSAFDGLADALIKVQDADKLFNQYPAELREKFDNDPVKFVDFLSDPKNLDEAIKLGLALPKPKVDVPVVPEPAPLVPPHS